MSYIEPRTGFPVVLNFLKTSSLLSTIIVITVTSIVFVATWTRLSSQGSVSFKSGDQHGSVPKIPHWFPYIAHAWDLFTNPERLLAAGHENSKLGVFALYILGKRHYVLCSSAQITIEEKQNLPLTANMLQYQTISNVSGISRSRVDVIGLLINYPTEGGGFFSTATVAGAITSLQEALPNLVTGCESRIDQMPWERDAEAMVVGRNSQGIGKATECDLFTLLSSFTNHLLMQAIPIPAGPELISTLSHQLHVLNVQILPLALGIPRWPAFFLPMPSVHASYRARRDVLRTLNSFPRDMNGSSAFRQWYEKVGIPKHTPEICTQVELVILWQMTKDVGVLVFWTLIHILKSSQNVLESAKREAESFVNVHESEPIIPGSDIREAPRTRIDRDMLENNQNYPTIFAYFLECVRVYSQHWTTRSISELSELEVKPNMKISVSGDISVDTAWELCYRDPTAFEEPNKHKPTRFINNVPDHQTLEIIADNIFLKHFHSSPSLLHIRSVAPIILATVASLLVVWEVQPPDFTKSHDKHALLGVGGIDLKLSDLKRTPSVALPSGSVRAQLKRYAVSGSSG